MKNKIFYEFNNLIILINNLNSNNIKLYVYLKFLYIYEYSNIN